MTFLIGWNFIIVQALFVYPGANYITKQLIACALDRWRYNDEHCELLNTVAGNDNIRHVKSLVKEWEFNF
jgi:hypothetical protein